MLQNYAKTAIYPNHSLGRLQINFLCLSCPEIALQQIIQHDRKKT
jgi:hypothetical protein